MNEKVCLVQTDAFLRLTTEHYVIGVITDAQLSLHRNRIVHSGFRLFCLVLMRQLITSISSSATVSNVAFQIDFSNITKWHLTACISCACCLWHYCSGRLCNSLHDLSGLYLFCLSVLIHILYLFWTVCSVLCWAQSLSQLSGFYFTYQAALQLWLP